MIFRCETCKLVQPNHGNYKLSERNPLIVDGAGKHQQSESAAETADRFVFQDKMT